MPDWHSVYSLVGVALGILAILILLVPVIMIPAHFKRLLSSGELKGADVPLTFAISLLMWLGFLFPAMLFLLSTLNSFGFPVFGAK